MARKRRRNRIDVGTPGVPDLSFGGTDTGRGPDMPLDVMGVGAPFGAGFSLGGPAPFMGGIPYGFPDQGQGFVGVPGGQPPGMGPGGIGPGGGPFMLPDPGEAPGNGFVAPGSTPDKPPLYSPPAPYGPERPAPLEPGEVDDLIHRAINYWRPRNRRMDEDLDFVRGQWGEQPESHEGKVADGLIPGNTLLATILQKFVAILSTADRTVSLEPTEPGQADLIQLGEDAWRFAEAQMVRAHGMGGRQNFYYEEAHYCCLRGWIAQRVMLNADRLYQGKFAVEVQIADPRTVFPVFGPDGLDWVVQEYQAAVTDCMALWPELPEILAADERLKELAPYDPLLVRALYSKWDIYYFVEGKYVTRVSHEYGFVPWIVIPVRGPVLATGMSNTALVVQRDKGLSQLVTGRTMGSNNTKDIGVSCFHEAIGPCRHLIQLQSVAATALEKGVDPAVIITGLNPASVEVDTLPGGRTLVPPDHQVTPLEPRERFEHLNLLIQASVANIERATIPVSMWGVGGPGPQSALDRRYQNATALDNLKPYDQAICQARELRWVYAMRQYALYGLEGSFRFATRQGSITEFQNLSPDQFQVLQDAQLSVRTKELLPGEKTAKAQIAMTLHQSGVLSLDTILGEEWLAVDDVGAEKRRILNEKASLHPLVQLAEMIDAVQVERPALWARIGPILLAEEQRVAAQTLVPPSPVAAPGQPSPPSSPGGEPGALGQQPPGSPRTPGNGGTPPPQQPPPLPQNTPGRDAVFAGMGGVLGGTGVGIPSQVQSPYALGQVQTGPTLSPLELLLQQQGIVPPTSAALPV